MRFALLGNHPDGLSLVRSLRATGRHELVAYAGPKTGTEALERLGATVKPTGDIEEVLADPTVEAVIVASPPGVRAAHLRRALQSERHVLCVHPADGSPDIAYEAGMIQNDTKHILLPVLTDGFHPALTELAKLLQPGAALGALGLLTVEEAGQKEVLIDVASAKHRYALPGWNMLRALAGEVTEVSAFATTEELTPTEPLLVSGRFQAGLFQYTLLPGQTNPGCRIRVLASNGTAELTIDRTDERRAMLRWTETGEEPHEQNFEAWDPFPTVLAAFEKAIEGNKSRTEMPTAPASKSRPALTWQDEINCLELDDAVRRSVERRRASTLEYHEVSEEVGFKGTMTLVGCGLLWGLIPLLLLSAWEKRLLWIVAPVLLIFLIMQLFRWAIPPREGQGPSGSAE